MRHERKCRQVIGESEENRRNCSERSFQVIESSWKGNRKLAKVWLISCELVQTKIEKPWKAKKLRT